MLGLALLLTLHLTPSGSGSAWRQPQLASDGERVGLVFGSGNTIHYAYSEDYGKSFSTPVLVSASGKLALGSHRGPRLVLQAGKAVVSAIVDDNLLVWTSDTNGRSWTGPARVNEVAGSAAEGLHAMAAANGWVVLAWLDLREKGTRVYSAVSEDGGVRFGPNRLVYASPDGHVCECCHPSVLVTPDGAIHVMFRNWLAGNRDLYLASSADKGESFRTEKLGRGSWALNACPMDGGALAYGSAGQVATVWRRQDTIYAASPGDAEVELGRGKDPVLAAGLDATLYAAWVRDGALVAVNNRKPEAVVLSPKGAYPQLLMMGNGEILAAWEQDHGIAVAPLR